jgi:6-pyruvoyltetrahydropterin/6-carboxytetrahydropterin synthase
MYRLNVTSSFSAAHRLVGYKGACKRLHGHNWKVRVSVACDELDPIGMAMDFKLLKSLLNDLLDEFDHQYLNELEAFKEHNPTSEAIARLLFLRLRNRLPGNARLLEVEVAESENSSVIYTENA